MISASEKSINNLKAQSGTELVLPAYNQPLEISKAPVLKATEKTDTPPPPPPPPPLVIKNTNNIFFYSKFSKFAYCQYANYES